MQYDTWTKTHTNNQNLLWKLVEIFHFATAVEATAVATAFANKIIRLCFWVAVS